MPYHPNSGFSLPRWISEFFKPRMSAESATAMAAAVECHACSTQVGVPAFHSTTCDGAHHQPRWVAFAGSSLVPIQAWPGPGDGASRRRPAGPFGSVLDPRSPEVKKWNRALLMARGVALAVDPLFFYTISVGTGASPCLYMDGGLAATLAIVRTCVDGVHVLHMWLQLRLAYVSRESMVIGCGKLVWDARAIASHYARSLEGLLFDVFVVLPVPQIILWLAVPKLIREERVKMIPILLLIFLFQFLPKVYHSICLMRRMRKVTGYVFGTIWWGFGINLIAYFIASHVAGGCWYVLATQRVVMCLQKQCDVSTKCNFSISCSKVISYQFPSPAESLGNLLGGNWSSPCFDNDGPFNYGIYGDALPVISSESLSVRVLYPIFWGLLNLSTFGNELEPTSNWLEVIFSICIVLSGLLLFTLLVGNIQIFLHAVMVKKKKILLRFRDIEWWMRRRQLPSHLRQRVFHFESQRLTITGGEDEMKLIEDLPDGLRHDIKRHLCLDLIKKVPLFHDLDDLVLDHICDRVKPLIFSKGEKIIREGDPVHRIIFIVHGLVGRHQSLSKGRVATNVLEPGCFLGDELLSWCLRRPFMDRLPASSATFSCMEHTEGFGLDAKDLKYVTEHFRYKFMEGGLKRMARYFSSNWRTWAAVNIQLAWRRYKMRTRGQVRVVIENGDAEHRLKQYAAMFMSLKPHDHLE
ncbi:hypothetical protein ACJRO7_004249 [Eucalyptus globulus]|uniref:Cyclic nucleotide-binding domain-containing protein n=1 Tax=Eucalyptus globulus TaxID=34317 RepID=A0ABD3IWQ5_EUCGL